MNGVKTIGIHIDAHGDDQHACPLLLATHGAHWADATRGVPLATDTNRARRLCARRFNSRRLAAYIQCCRGECSPYLARLGGT